MKKYILNQHKNIFIEFGLGGYSIVKYNDGTGYEIPIHSITLEKVGEPYNKESHLLLGMYDEDDSPVDIFQDLIDYLTDESSEYPKYFEMPRFGIGNDKE